jgi:surface antigen
MFFTNTIKRIALAAISLPLVFAGITTVHAQAGRTNPYPAGTSQYWAWQNRPDLPAGLGAPYAWADNASQYGFPISQYPRRGDVAVFAPGVLGADPQSGEVAFVEQVLEDGQFTASVMEGQVSRHTYDLQAGTTFIPYLKDTRTTWGFSSGQSGWTAYNLGEGNMGGPGWFYPLAGDDPYLVSPDLEIPLDGAYTTIEVDIAQGIPVGDPTIQVYFATADRPDFIESNSVKLRGKADGELHRFTFYFGTNPEWQGTLTRLRLDPAQGGSDGGVRIDRVRLVQAGAQSPALPTQPTEPYTTYSVPTGNHGGRHR